MLADDSPFIRTHPPPYVCPSRAEGTWVSFNTASENRCDLCRPPSCEWSLAGVCPRGSFAEVDGGRTHSVGVRRECALPKHRGQCFCRGPGWSQSVDTVTIFRCPGFRPALCPSQGPRLEEHFPNWPQPKGTKRASIRLAPSPGEAPGRAAPPPS